MADEPARRNPNARRPRDPEVEQRLANVDDFKDRAESWMKEITTQVARLASGTESEEKKRTALDKRLADIEQRIQSLLTLTEMISADQNPFVGKGENERGASSTHGRLGDVNQNVYVAGENGAQRIQPVGPLMDAAYETQARPPPAVLAPGLEPERGRMPPPQHAPAPAQQAHQEPAPRIDSYPNEERASAQIRAASATPAAHEPLAPTPAEAEPPVTRSDQQPPREAPMLAADEASPPALAYPPSHEQDAPHDAIEAPSAASETTADAAPAAAASSEAASSSEGTSAGEGAARPPSTHKAQRMAPVIPQRSHVAEAPPAVSATASAAKADPTPNERSHANERSRAPAETEHVRPQRPEGALPGVNARERLLTLEMAHTLAKSMPRTDIHDLLQHYVEAGWIDTAMAGRVMALALGLQHHDPERPDDDALHRLHVRITVLLSYLDGETLDVSDVTRTLDTADHVLQGDWL